MGMTNIERMVESLVRDEMNMVRSMSLEDMDSYVEDLIRQRLETMSNEDIIDLYQEIA